MPEIIRTFPDPAPAMRFIGKRYPGYGSWWGEWFANGWFDAVENAMGGPDRIKAIWENGGGYCGLERRVGSELTDYWIGMFTPAGTKVPDGFECVDFPGGNIGTCWLRGKEDEVHDTSGFFPALDKAGIKPKKDAAVTDGHSGAVWIFENGLCPRFTTPDVNGNVILDWCCFAE